MTTDSRESAIMISTSPTPRSPRRSLIVEDADLSRLGELDQSPVPTVSQGEGRGRGRDARGENRERRRRTAGELIESKVRVRSHVAGAKNGRRVGAVPDHVRLRGA